MPLFSHNNHNNTMATGPGTNVGPGYDTRAANDRVGPLGTGSGPTMLPAQPAPGSYGSSDPAAGQGACQSRLPPGQYNNQGGFAGGDPYANTVGNNDVAPVHHLSSGQRTGHTSSATGKVERIIGTVVCSQSLKAKGIEKEQQAAAYQAQNAHLSEAERLEQEALIRRQRAVECGAHPANKALGGAAQAQEFGGNFGQAGAPGSAGPTSGGAVPSARGGLL